MRYLCGSEQTSNRQGLPCLPSSWPLSSGRWELRWGFPGHEALFLQQLPDLFPSPPSCSLSCLAYFQTASLGLPAVRLSVGQGDVASAIGGRFTGTLLPRAGLAQSFLLFWLTGLSFAFFFP